MVTLFYTLCLMAGLTSVHGLDLDCACDCQKLKTENNLMKSFIGQKPDKLPELLGSFEEGPTVDNEREPTALWRESQIISTYKTLITSLAVTEIPIWWRNRLERKETQIQ